MASSSKMSKKSVQFSPSEMDPATLTRLFEECGCFVLVDAPDANCLEFGIDLNTWRIGSKFQGLKLIPPGLHLINFAVVKDDFMGPRTSFFHVFGRGELLAKRFDAKQERFLDVDETTAERIRGDLRNVERFLGAYDHSKWKQWVALTNHVSQATVDRLEPLCGHVFAVDDLVPNEFRANKHEKRRETSRIEASNSDQSTNGDDGLPKMNVRPGTAIRYTSVPEERFPADASPEQITRHAMDHSYRLDLVLSGLDRLYGDQVSSSMNYSHSWKELLGELQFSFVCFLVSHHYASFEQWKKLLSLLCSSHQAVAKHKELYMALLSDLHFQIKEVPSDLFVDIVSSDNFLHTLLGRLFTAIRTQNDVDNDLRERARRFEANISVKFEWTFDEDEDDIESQPTIVELTESQRNMLFPQQ